MASIDRSRPVAVLDTSALIELFRTASKKSAGTPLDPRESALLKFFQSVGSIFYHPISISEIADYLHSEVWACRRAGTPQKAVTDGIRARRFLLVLLHSHRKQAPAAKDLLAGCRALPYVPAFEVFTYVAHQRSQRIYVRQLPGRTEVVPLLTMVDHHILAVGCWLARSGFDARFVSGDKHQLAAAEKLGVKWTYAYDASRSHPFPWT